MYQCSGLEMHFVLPPKHPFDNATWHDAFFWMFMAVVTAVKKMKWNTFQKGFCQPKHYCCYRYKKWNKKNIRWPSQLHQLVSCWMTIWSSILLKLALCHKCCLDCLLLVLNPEYFMQDIEILICKESLYTRFVCAYSRALLGVMQVKYSFNCSPMNVILFTKVFYY